MTGPVRHIVLMGPAGAGKSTVGRRAARLAGVPFFEGDDYHPPRNKEIIAAGGALSDADRAPWIDAIAEAVTEAGAPSCVIACSALNAAIRERLAARLPGPPLFVLLDVPERVLAMRLKTRRGHFAGPAILRSQLAAMDAGRDVVRIDGTLPIKRAAAAVAALFLQEDG